MQMPLRFQLRGRQCKARGQKGIDLRLVTVGFHLNLKGETGRGVRHVYASVHTVRRPGAWIAVRRGNAAAGPQYTVIDGCTTAQSASGRAVSIADADLILDLPKDVDKVELEATVASCELW